jgi:SAM-dependent methyltransferase
MTEASFPRATRESCHAVGVHRPVGSGPNSKLPLERALLAAFAELVTAGGKGPVANIGCGDGGRTKALIDLGLDAFGIDPSPEMVALARRGYPGVRFGVGSMLTLEMPDAYLGGVLASYSIIHIPWHLRLDVFAEFLRVLAPGGALMLMFQVGDDRGHRDHVDGPAVSLDWYRHLPHQVTDLLVTAGFEIRATTVRAAAPGAEKVPQVVLLAGKAAAPTTAPEG